VLHIPQAADVKTILERAWNARQKLLPPATAVFRWIHDAADGTPALAIDAAAGVAMVQAWDERWRSHVPAVVNEVQGFGFTGVRAVVRGRGGLPAGEEFRAGILPDEHTGAECGLAFRLRVSDTSLSFGLFPDARMARARVRQLALGARTLNLYAYAGGFTVAALAGGAESVDQVDSAVKVASWAARNVALNGFSPRQCRFIADDVQAFVARAVRSGRAYDLVVTDPPTFGRSACGWQNTRDLAPVLVDSLRVVTSGGRLALSAHTQGLEVHQLWQTLIAAAGQAHCTVTLEEQIHPGGDFPWMLEMPQQPRFKMLVVRVER
jgi:23S rRNA (cytosine1962-C5)-methyltransferase